MLGKLEKVPFDIAEAETEIVAGTLTEYSGRLLGLFKLALDIETIVGASLLAVVFLPFGFNLGPEVGFILLKTPVSFKYEWSNFSSTDSNILLASLKSTAMPALESSL